MLIGWHISSRTADWPILYLHKKVFRCWLAVCWFTQKRSFPGTFWKLTLNTHRQLEAWHGRDRILIFCALPCSLFWKLLPGFFIENNTGSFPCKWDVKVPPAWNIFCTFKLGKKGGMYWPPRISPASRSQKTILVSFHNSLITLNTSAIYIYLKIKTAPNCSYGLSHEAVTKIVENICPRMVPPALFFR